MQLLIGGDLVPTQSNIDLFSSGDVTTLIGDELHSLTKAADIFILNLEVPLTDKRDPIAKAGPNLIAPTNTVKGIKALNPTLLTLANNHILDQGVQGLKSTEQVLSENEISYVGIGNNLAEANKPFILEHSGVKIGFYACAEHEFTIATHISPGANPFDPLESLDHIQNLKVQCDYVIVLYHGGKEHYRYPSPYLQKVCRKVVEKGADLVVCQHSHCIGCFEEYEGSTIVYGQGNFLFDNSNSDFWQTGLLVDVRISDSMKIDYIPIVKVNNFVRIANEIQRKEILQGFKQRSNDIEKEGFIEQNYEMISSQLYNVYLMGVHGDNFIFKVINKLCKHRFVNLLYSQKALLWIRNIIECEAHRELFLKGISIRGKFR